MNSEIKQYAVIIPGLGDHGERFKWLTSNWETDYQVIPIIHLAGWSKKGKSYQEIIADLHELIIHLKQGGNCVALLGASAGGSLAFNGLVSFPEEVTFAANLCGRLKVGEEGGFRSFQTRAKGVSSFAESVQRIETSIPELPAELKQRMLITKGLWDELVPEETMTVQGIQAIRVPFIEHGINISLSVATYPWLGRFAKGNEVLKFIKGKSTL